MWTGSRADPCNPGGSSWGPAEPLRCSEVSLAPDGIHPRGMSELLDELPCGNTTREQNCQHCSACHYRCGSVGHSRPQALARVSRPKPWQKKAGFWRRNVRDKKVLGTECLDCSFYGDLGEILYLAG